VAAPLLNDTFFLEEVDDAKSQIKDTVEKIHQFDYNQSKALEELSNDVSKMQNYIDRIQSHTKSGKIQLENYTIGTVKKYQIDDLLLENTCSREDTDTKEELQKKLANAYTIEEFLKLAKELGDENLTEEQKRLLTLWETAEGIKNGVYKAGKDFVKGLFNFVLHPVKTIESTIDALAHPIKTFDFLSTAIRESYERDVINGDAKSRAEWFAYALGSIGLSAVGTKGLGAVSKTGMATTKVATNAAARKLKGAISDLDLLPYSPRNQLAYANASVVPYNVVNGAGVKDQLLSMVKVETKGSGKGTDKVTRLKSRKLSSDQIELEWLADKYTAVEVKGTVKVGGKEVEVSRRVYQIKIDKNYVPNNPKALGKSNGELMKKGKSPYISKDGVESKVELHHLIQKEPGGMVEIAELTHDKYDSTLHGLAENGQSFRNKPELEKMYNNFRSNYWKMRASE
ncbi:HNH/ENDO VII family nuclease, partial [Rummeliibacillus sp. POC4]|uniref:HNH/ENDO VII family nuclease n=1 Tax=Rummeliibacillus sp. POC4 TaxID=2305899 RepID=UPI000E665F12